jgi:arsenate reductase-like glutaredoxin family protein
VRSRRSVPTSASCEMLPVIHVGDKAINVQVFGTRKSADTRKALRFFSERRVKTHFVDFAERGPALAELRRFIAKFGVDALVDRESRRFAELGLTFAHYAPAWWEEKLLVEPSLLLLPLVRCGNRVSVGLAETEWRTWVE